MAREKNLGPLSRLRELRERLATWPAAPLHESAEEAGTIGSAPSDAVTPSHSDSLAQIVGSGGPAATPSAAETTAIEVAGGDDAGDRPSDAQTRAMPVAAADADSESDDDDADDTVDEADGAGDTAGAGEAPSPLRTVGPVSTVPPVDETARAETEVLPTASRPSTDETVAIPVIPRDDAAAVPAEDDEFDEPGEPENDETNEAEQADEDATTVDGADAPAEDAPDADATSGASPTAPAAAAGAATVAAAGGADTDTDVDEPVEDIAEPAAPTEQQPLPDATPATEALPVAAPAPAPAADTAVEPAGAPVPAPQRQAPEYHAPAGGSTASEPRSGGKTKWIVAAVIAVIALIIAGFALLSTSKSGDRDDARQAAANATTSFVSAVNRGDLAALRQQTCGGAKAYYDKIDDARWQRIHDNAKNDGMLPELDGLQAVEVRDDRAEVQVEVHYVSNPQAKVRNTLTLENDGGGWKVCTQVGAR